MVIAFLGLSYHTFKSLCHTLSQKKFVQIPLWKFCINNFVIRAKD